MHSALGGPVGRLTKCCTLDVQGIPRIFSGLDRTLLRGFHSFGGYLPGVAAPLVKARMREETANVILPAEEALLVRHLEARRQSGVRMNVNFLGEAVLGEAEARRRMDSYLWALQIPEVEVISVKISTLYSQIVEILPIFPALPANAVLAMDHMCLGRLQQQLQRNRLIPSPRFLRWHSGVAQKEFGAPVPVPDCARRRRRTGQARAAAVGVLPMNQTLTRSVCDDEVRHVDPVQVPGGTHTVPVRSGAALKKVRSNPNLRPRASARLPV